MSKRKRPVVVASDLHYGGLLYSQRPTLKGDSEYAFEWVIDYANRVSAECLLLAGDLFDVPNISPSTLASFIKQLDRCECRIVYCRGDHDGFMGQPGWLDVSDVQNAKFPHPFKRGLVPVHSIDYCESFEEFDGRMAAAKFRPGDVLLTHQKWMDFLGSGGIAGMTFSAVVQQWAPSVLITGDLHDNRLFKVGDTVVASPGCTHRRKRNDAGGSCFLWESELTKVDIPGRRWVDYSINTAEDLQEFSRQLPGLLESSFPEDHPLSTNILTVKTAVGLALSSQLADAVAGRAHLFVVPDRRERVKREHDDRPAQASSDVLKDVLDGLRLPSRVRQSVNALLVCSEDRIEEEISNAYSDLLERYDSED